MGHKFDITIDTKVIREVMVKYKPLPTTVLQLPGNHVTRQGLSSPL